jgi:hypothetical protein
MRNNREILEWVLAVAWIICAMWLLVQPVSVYAGQDATAKSPLGNSGWVYNNKTYTLQFCTQISGEINDADAKVVCLEYPKKVKEVDGYDSFFLDGGFK